MGSSSEEMSAGRSSALRDDLPAVGGAPADVRVFEGEVESALFTELSFAVPGRVEAIFVNVGDTVREGQKLAALDQVDRQVLLTETRRRLSEARGAARRTGTTNSRQGPPAWLRSELTKRMRLADQQRPLDESDLAAFRKAGEQGDTEELEKILKRRAWRKGQSTRAGRNDVEKRNADERVAIALIANLEQREARLVRELEESTLRAPTDGMLAKVSAVEGDSVQTRVTEPAFVLIRPQDYVLRVPVPADFARVLGDADEVWVDPGEGGAPGVATIQAIEPTEYPSGVGDERLQDLIVTPESSMVSDLTIGQQVRVALRR